MKWFSAVVIAVLATSFIISFGDAALINLGSKKSENTEAESAAESSEDLDQNSRTRSRNIIRSRGDGSKVEKSEQESENSSSHNTRSRSNSKQSNSKVEEVSIPGQQQVVYVPGRSWVLDISDLNEEVTTPKPKKKRRGLIGSVVGGVADVASDVVGTAGNIAKSGINAASNVAKSGVNAAANVAKSGVHIITDTGRAASDLSKDILKAANSVGEVGLKFISETGVRAEDALTAVAGGVEQISHDILHSGLVDSKGNIKIDTPEKKQKAKVVVEDVQGTALDTYNKLMDLIPEVSISFE